MQEVNASAIPIVKANKSSLSSVVYSAGLHPRYAVRKIRQERVCTFAPFPPVIDYKYLP